MAISHSLLYRISHVKYALFMAPMSSSPPSRGSLGPKHWQREVGCSTYTARGYAMATGGLPSAIQPFNGKNWSSWMQRLTYFVASDVSDKGKKRDSPDSMWSQHLRDCLRALVAMKAPREVSFGDMVTLLQKHFNPRLSELYSWYVFPRCNQQLRCCPKQFDSRLTLGGNNNVCNIDAAGGRPNSHSNEPNRTAKQPFQRTQQCCPKTSCFATGLSAAPATNMSNKECLLRRIWHLNVLWTWPCHQKVH